MNVPGFLGFASFEEEMSGFVAGHREFTDEGVAFYLATMCVRPDLQRSGVGGGLIKHLEGALKAIGVNLIYLITHRGGRAEFFYKRDGYKVSREDVVMIREF